MYTKFLLSIESFHCMHNARCRGIV